MKHQSWLSGTTLRAASPAVVLAVVLASAIIATESAQAQTLSTLHSFAYPHGAFPRAGLTQGTDGSFYGTTTEGGAKVYGTAFKITPGGKLTTLHSFCAQRFCADGAFPAAGLIQATNGDFYGTTTGTTQGKNDGTVFKITPGGTLTTLYRFCSESDCVDGISPYGGLLQATDGNLYGTTVDGGANDYGTVFKISPSGTLTTLHSFDRSDGANPYGGLIEAGNGSFYGTTTEGSYKGTVFTMTPDGTLTTLYTFCQKEGCSDGAYPYAGLVQATNGNFYGTTWEGGDLTCNPPFGCGTVFKITSTGALTTLYRFCPKGDCASGALPLAGLVQGTDGNLYGTTTGEGINNGTVFKIVPGGGLTTLYSFCSQSSCADGSEPYAGLIQGTDGSFYGTTMQGGANTLGTVFSLSVALGPFVETQPSSGKIGAELKILGSDLTGASSVTFNGAAAAFTVVSASLITTTVPADAATGPVQVVTPGGTLNSNVRFRVRP
ncbi:MAG: choice-of-anchor tandem repeat GloVer-containing protein [Candidatus Sulfotelmatobacter sp.]